MHKRIHGGTHQNKIKSRVDDGCLFQSLYSCTVAETVKEGVSGIKQKKWTPPLNSAYYN